MKTITRITVICLFSMAPAILYSQSVDKLDINIQTKNDGKWRELTPVVKQGSGEYLFLWICSAKYGIASGPNSKMAKIPMDEEDITYQVFVRDQKTGALGHKAINFSKNTKKVSSIAYPNPSSDGELTVSLTDGQSTVLNDNYHIVKAELYSEKLGSLVMPIDLPSGKEEEVKINTHSLQPGIYYVHLWLRDNVHSEAIKREIRVLVDKK